LKANGPWKRGETNASFPYHLAWERRLIVWLGSFLLPTCAQTVIRLDRIVIGDMRSGSIMDYNNPVSDSFPFLFPRHSNPTRDTGPLVIQIVNLRESPVMYGKQAALPRYVRSRR
jgi:hypothetical protein